MSPMLARWKVRFCISPAGLCAIGSSRGSRRSAFPRLAAWRFRHARGCRAIRIERAQATPAPGGGELRRRAVVILAAVSKLIGEFEEGAEEGGAIVVHQFDQTGLLHQPAQFD